MFNLDLKLCVTSWQFLPAFAFTDSEMMQISIYKKSPSDCFDAGYNISILVH